MKEKRTRIVILVLVLLLLVCGSVYTAYRLHPESFIGKDDILTRGEFAAILVNDIPLDPSNAEKDPPSFSDIDSHWSEKSIEALIDAGILDPADYPDGFFRPDEPITRPEIIKMLVRLHSKDEEAKNTQGHTGYDDQDEINDNDKGYVIIGREDGIIGDTDDNKMHPNDPVTKGDADEMIDNTDKPEPTPDESPSSTDADEDNPSPSPEPDDDDDYEPYYPPAEIRFELAEIAHTDTELNVMPVWKYMKSFEWTLTKTDIDGADKPVGFSEAVIGSLGKEGGIIRFTEAGQYTLTATAKNATGKETVLSKQITVYPVVDVSFDIPDTLHTDKTAPLVVSQEKLFGYDIVWTATKDSEAIEIDDVLYDDNNGGSGFAFTEKGEYTLTATVTDETGRVFTHTENVKVYPIAEITFDLSATAHTDTTVNVTTTLSNSDGLPVNWSLTKNGEVVDIADAAEGTLNDDGGALRFKDKGVYMLTGSLTDETGRVFEVSDTITVYPVGSIGFYTPEITHSDKAIKIEARFENLGDAMIEWTLAKNGAPVSISSAVDGVLTNNGGLIRFISKGDYILKASFTDPAGRSYSYTAPVKVYPVPSFSFTLPETAYTDSVINVVTEATGLDGLTVEWKLENGMGFQDWNTYVSGTLDNDGGMIRFKHAGIYELIARVTDETGRVFLFENGGWVEVLPVLSISFELPESTHTDRTIDMRTRGNNNVLPVDWTITRNGEIVDASEVIEGSINAYGGRFSFKQVGDYTFTASMTDALGRVFSHSESTSVYPIPAITLAAPQIWYAGEASTVSVTGTDLDGLTADWTITKNDGAVEPYSVHATGSLSKTGGSITIATKGDYEMTLTMTDATGRTFVRSRECTVYPVPQMSITVPSLKYSGDAISVTVTGTEFAAMNVNWLASLDGAPTREFSELVLGALGNYGGNIVLSTSTTKALRLTAEVTDVNGRKFFFTSNAVTVKPVASFPFTAPTDAHIGGNISISLPTTSGLEGRTLIWTLTKDGAPAAYSGTLTNSGGTIVITATGDYVLTASTTDSEGRVFTYTKSFSITNTAPNKPTGSATVIRTTLNGKLKVNISASATDADGDAVTLEYSGTSADGYYPVGVNTVYVRAKDAWGLYSDWTAITFTVANSAPTTPVITRTPDGNSIAPGVAITITASSTDADGDAITYVWEGRPALTSTAYPLGKNVVRVKAVDSTGAESPWAAIVFFIADPNRGGGMTLTGPDSIILEEGIAGATITNYTFTVPPVDGHSGQDYGRVRGYNVLTGAWDQLDYGTTTNGITFSRTLSPGVYSQLEFYYYTNHSCMYNKSNITYSVSFYFE